MKKLVLTFSLVIMLACLFAIGISAASISTDGVPDWGETKIVEGMTEKSTFANGTSQRVMLKDLTTGEMTTYPAYYIFANSTTISYDLTEIVEKTGANYDTTSIVALEIPEGIKSTKDTSFAGGAFVYIKTASSISSWNWKGLQACTALIRVDMAENPTSTTVPSFRGSTSLKYVNIPEGYIKVSSFYGTAIESITFPNTIKTLGSEAFYDCKSLKSINFGASFESFGNRLIEGASTGPIVITMPSTIFTEGIDFPSSGKQLFGWGGQSKDITFLYTGTKAQAEALVQRAMELDANAAPFSTATLISAADYEELEDKTPSGYKIVYDYSACVAYYDSDHQEREVTYDFCGQKYISDLYSYTACERCTVVKEAKAANPVFVSRGYSINEKDKDSFVFDVVVDFEAMQIYYEKTGATEELSYGLALSGNTALTSLINADGTVVDERNVLKISFDNTEYTKIQIKINNVKTEASKATKLFACMYVIENGAVKYIGEGVTTDIPESVCYNDIL